MINKAGLKPARQFSGWLEPGQSGGLRGHHPVPASAGQGGIGAPARLLPTVAVNVKKLTSRPEEHCLSSTLLPMPR
jgi:hypothetical protein